METITIQTTNRYGDQALAEMLVCTICQGRTWLIYIVHGEQHSHFQCTTCGGCLCPDGLCGKG